MIPPKQRSPQFRSIVGAEQRLQRTISDFVRQYDEQIQPIIMRLCASWCREFGNQSSHFPQAGIGLGDLAEEIHRVHWRDYYRQNRESILQRQRRNYRRRRSSGQQPESNRQQRSYSGLLREA
jgi:hypothetical protein